MDVATAILLGAIRTAMSPGPSPGVALLPLVSEDAGATSVTVAPNAIPVGPTDPLSFERHGVRRVGRPGVPLCVQAAMPPFAQVALLAGAAAEVLAVRNPMHQFAIGTIAQTRRIVVAAVALARAVHDPDAIAM